MTILATFTRLVKRLRRSEHGVAAVEFALILPVMLTAYVGSLEASALITMDRKIQSVSSSVGDLVAQSNVTLAKDTFIDFLRAAGGIMSPYRDNNLQQSVVQVAVAANGTTKVVWSWDFKNDTLTVGTKYPKDSSFSLPAEMIDISRGSNVIVAEASNAYRPLYGIIIESEINLRRQSFYLPRFGGSITIK